MDKIKCLLISMNGKDGKRIFIKLYTKPNKDVKKIYEALVFKERPCTRKTKVMI